MRTLLCAMFFAGTVLLTLPMARAEEPPKLSDMDCSALNGTPLICVKNYTKRAITTITCSGMWGETALSIPGGSIAPSSMTIVSFSMGKCNKMISLKTRGGNPLVVQGFDTSANTVLNIKDD